MALFLVATPIGNLQDISPRALEVLRTVDFIACEDTRHSQKLLNHYGIKNRLISYHEHNESERADQLVKELVSGRSVAIISDAGTPGICDPGFRLVEAARNAGVGVVPIPGPVAFVAAVTGSGLATDSIFFGGFLPARSSERRKRLEDVREIPATLVFYETPHRIAKALADCLEILGDRRACVVRELTKLHEEFTAGTLSDLAERFRDGAKGELVLIIDREAAPLPFGEMSLADRVRQLEADGLDPKSALKKAAKDFGLSKSEAYRRLLEAKTG